MTARTGWGHGLDELDGTGRPRCGRSSPLSLHRHDDIADVALGHEDILRLGELAQGEGLGEHRPEPVALDQRHQSRHRAGRGNGGAGELQVLVDELALTCRTHLSN